MLNLNSNTADMPIVNFNTKEKEFLNSNKCCREATCHDNIPHIVPGILCI